MKNLIIRLPFFFFIMGSTLITIKTSGTNLCDSVPKGWQTRGKILPDVVIGNDTVIKHTGRASGFLYRAPSPTYAQFAILQRVSADAYRNKRVRLTAYAKSKDVERAIINFMAVSADTILSFANTFSGPIQETTDWTMYSVTIDVPQESINIEFDLIFMGQGSVWIDDYNLEIVDNSIPSDDIIVKGLMKKHGFGKRMYPPNSCAMNLGFEDQ